MTRWRPFHVCTAAQAVGHIEVGEGMVLGRVRGGH